MAIKKEKWNTSNIKNILSPRICSGFVIRKDGNGGEERIILNDESEVQEGDIFNLVYLNPVGNRESTIQCTKECYFYALMGDGSMVKCFDKGLRSYVRSRYVLIVDTNTSVMIGVSTLPLTAYAGCDMNVETGLALRSENTFATFVRSAPIGLDIFVSNNRVMKKLPVLLALLNDAEEIKAGQIFNLGDNIKLRVKQASESNGLLIFEIILKKK